MKNKLKAFYAYKFYILLLIASFSHFTLKAQGQLQLANVVIQGHYIGKNMHNLLMDVNSTGPIYIAYDVDKLKKIPISSSPDGQSLDEIFNAILGNMSFDIINQDDNTYLLRYDNHSIVDFNSDRIDNIEYNGQILDAVGLPLAYAYVMSPNLQYGSYADSLGRYKLYIPKNQIPVELCAGNLGFKNRCQKINIHNKKQNFTLNEDSEMIEILTVIDIALPIKIMENAYFLKMSKRFNISSPGGKDPLRKAALMPSVQADNDLSAEIRIRNAQSDETAIIYDNIPLFSSYHYAGFISNINPVTVEEILIYPCYTPADLSNKSAGLVNIKSRDNKQLGLSGEIGLNFLYASTMLQYRNENHLVQLAGRTNIGDISNKAFYVLSNEERNTIINPDGTKKTFTPINPLYNFKDFNFKYKWEINNKWALSLLHLRSSDNTKSSLEYDFRLREIKNVIFQQTQTENEQTNSIGSSVQLRGQLNDRWKILFSVVQSNLMFNNDASTTTINIKNPKKERVQDAFDISNNVEWQEAKLHLTYQNNPLNKFDVGYTINRYSTSLKYKFANRVDVQNDISKVEHHLFSSWKKSFLSVYELNVAANIKLEDSDQPLHLSPRISLSRKIKNNLKIKLEYGKYQQQLRKINHENPYGKSFEFWTISRGDSIPNINADMYDFNIEYKSSDLIISSSLFYRTSDGNLAWISPKPRRNPKPNMGKPKLNYIYYKGESKSYGLESMIYYQFKPFQALVSYQLSKSLDSYERIRQGEWQPDENDRRHRITSLLNYRINRLTIEGKFTFLSGKPYVDLSKIEEESNRNNKNYEDIYSVLPDYKRFDLSLSYDFKIKKSTISTSLEIINLFNYVNTDYRQFYNNDLLESISGSSYNQLERFFNFGIDVSF